MNSVIIAAFDNELNKVLKILNRDNVLIRAIISCPTGDLERILHENAVEAPIFMYNDMPELLKNMYFDYAIVSDVRKFVGTARRIVTDLEYYGCRHDQIIDVSDFYTEESFSLYSLVRHYLVNKDIDAEFFITGVSHAYAGTDISCYKKMGLNLSFTSQDLFLDFELAKMVLREPGRLRYALIGVAPFSLNYDLSQSVNEYRMLLYFPLIKSMHNSRVGVEAIYNIFNESFLDSFVNFDDKVLYQRRMAAVVSDGQISADDYMNIRRVLRDWEQKEYPETVAENKRILRNYAELCITKGIKPVFVIFPLTSWYNRYFSKKKFDEVRMFLKTISVEYGAAFLDLSTDSRFFDTDFYDVEHLNIRGAKKVSRLLSDTLFE